LEQPLGEGSEEPDRYAEEYHLEGGAHSIVSVYKRIKQGVSRIDPEVKINP